MVRDQIDVGSSFRLLGAESVDLVALAAELSEWLGRTISPVEAWRNPTVERLAASLAGAPTKGPAASQRAGEPGEPIAIVGMGCRFPGGAHDPEAYWRLLVDGVDAVVEVPPERWAIDTFYSAAGGPGRMDTRWGGFLTEPVDAFDPLFFGISPREAEQMDPQQRLMLELTWEALEDGAIDPLALRGERVGVFFGVLFADYSVLQARIGPTGVTAHTSTGGAHCIVPNRVSYALGLEGPSMAVDTACSSSLVAVHLAAQSLRSGESRLALAGGVNLMLAPDTTVGFSQLGAMSPTGRSRAFSDAADGYVRGEGGGVIVLERLTDALRAGRRIWAVIRGSGVNNDGASNGLTAPNPSAQQSVIRDALAAAGLQADAVQVVEAHGTGTPLGDPIEAGALGAVYGLAGERSEPVRVGSAKTNVGHLEAAAGVAGLTKLALALHHGRVPPSLHFERPNPLIDFEQLNLVVPTAAEPWPATGPDGVRRGAVSSFGYGGTNSHVIVEAPPNLSMSPRFRLGERPEPIRGMAWVFSGQGSQWQGMGRGLWACHPVFRSAFGEASAAIVSAGGPDAVNVIWSDDPSSAGLFDAIDVIWPTLFAMHWALAETLASEGVWPDAVVGHSIGEVGAACVAGVLSLAEGARLIVAQSRRVAGAAGDGAMALVGLDAETMHARIRTTSGDAPSIDGLDDSVSCAIEAGPAETVVSGSASAVAALLAAMQAEGVFARPIRTDAAVHGPAMDGLFEDLGEAVGEWLPRAPSVPVYLTTTGLRLESARQLDVPYWSRQLGVPVRFRQAIEAMAFDGIECFVEIAPHPIVRRSVATILERLGAEGCSRALLGRGEQEGSALRDALAALEAEGRRRPAPAAGASAGSAVDAELGALLVISDRSPDGVRAQAGALADAIDGMADDDDTTASSTDGAPTSPPLVARCHGAPSVTFSGLGAVARRLATRPALEHRLAVPAADTAEAVEALGAIARGEPWPAASRGFVVGEASSAPKVVFVFPGQGGQWLGMGRELLACERVFRDRVQAVDAALAVVDAPSVLGALDGSGSLDDTDMIQPALFAMQLGLAALWRSWGVEPAAVIGHSMGEVAAACVAGALSLEDGARIISRRSRIARLHASGKGGMAVVGLPAEQVEAFIDGRGPAEAEQLSVAVINSPGACVLSGACAALDRAMARLAADGVFVRPIQVDYASHSPMMTPLQPLLAEALDGVRAMAPAVPFWSTVRDGFIEGPALGVDYWIENLRAPVRFASGVEGLRAWGADVFVEVNPHPLLCQPIAETVAHSGHTATVLESMRRDTSATTTLRVAAGQLFVRGASLRAGAISRSPVEATLPPRLWQRGRHWIRAVAHSGVSRAPLMPSALLTGARRVDVAVEPPIAIWSLTLDASRLPMLVDHQVRGEVWFPATGFVELIRGAAADRWAGAAVAIEEVRLSRALSLPEEGGVELQIQFECRSVDRWVVRVLSEQAPSGGGDGAGQGTEKSWQLHVTAVATAYHRDAGAGLDDGFPFGAAPAGVVSRRGGPTDVSESLAAVDQARHIEAMAARGLAYGPAFQVVDSLRVGAGEAIAELALPSAAQPAGGFLTHPVLLDGGLQALIAAASVPPRELLLPVTIRSITTGGGGLPVRACARVEFIDEVRVGGRVELVDEGGRSVVVLEGVELQRMRVTTAGPRAKAWMHQQVWLAADRLPRRRLRRRVLVYGSGGGFGDEVAERLIAAGADTIRVLPGDGSPHLLGPGVCSLDGHQQEVWSELFARLGPDGMPQHIVHLGSLDSPSTAALDSLAEQGFAGLLEAQQQGLGSAIELARGVPDGFDARLWLVTLNGGRVEQADPLVDPMQAPVWGLARTLRYERPELRTTIVDLGAVDILAEIDALVAEVAADAGARPAWESEIALRAGRRFVGRITTGDPRPAAEPAPFLADPRRHAVSLSMADGRLVFRAVAPRAPGPGQVLVGVDAFSVTGIEPAGRLRAAAAGETTPVCGLAGTVVAVGLGVDRFHIGDAVMGVCAGLPGSLTPIDAHLLVHRPIGLSVEDAAARLPAALVAHRAVFDLASGYRGERLWLHDPGSAEGRAIARQAERLGLEVVHTAIDRASYEALRDQGVNVLPPHAPLLEAGQAVLVCTGPLPQRFASSLDPFGRLITIAPIAGRDLEALPTNVTHTRVDLATFVQRSPARLGAALRDVATTLATEQALPVRRLTRLSAVPGAGPGASTPLVFSFGDQPCEAHRPRQAVAVVPQRGTVLLTGGTGGLGLVTAAWLIREGAAGIALMSRSVPDRFARERAHEWRSRGVMVRFVRGDVAVAADVVRVLGEIDDTMPPLRGIMHIAGVLHDSTVNQLNADQLRAVLLPKVVGAWNLHTSTRGRALELFVLYSSITALVGSPGQGNYAASNAFLDALAALRRQQGLAATSVQWGPWAEVGMAAAHANRGERLALQGLGTMNPGDAIEAVHGAIATGAAALAVGPWDRKRWLESWPALADDARMHAEGDDAAPADDIRAALASCPRGGEGRMLQTFVAGELAEVLRVPPSRVAIQQPFQSLGLDSLMVIELRGRLERRLGVSLGVSFAFDTPTVASLTEDLLGRLDAIAPSPAVGEVDEPSVVDLPDSKTDIEALTDAALLELISSLDDAL